MNCLVNIWNSFINSFLFDGPWWKDYGIPLLGAIGVPMLVWLLTWFYGAGRAEKQKELEKLRDNLNLLLNLVGINIVALLSNKRFVVKMEKQLEQDKLDLVELEKNDFFNKIFFNDLLQQIDITNYTQCLRVDEQYLNNLITLKNINFQINQTISNRNNVLADIANCENINIKQSRIESFIYDNKSNIKMLSNKMNLGIKASMELIEETENLEKKISNLKLIKVDFDNNEFYKKAKEEYELYLKNLEMNNDK